MTNKSVSDLFIELNAAQNKLKEKHEAIDSLIKNDIAAIHQNSTRSISEEEKIDYSEIKKGFGKLFYGALCPINGVNPKNKRLSDGSNVGGYDAPKGPAVWKKIGYKHRWSSRINWMEPRDLFDKFTADHLDLIIDGERNRLDQKKVAKDMFESRNFIKEKLDKVAGEKVDVSLSTEYDLDVIVTDNDGPLFSFKHKFKKIYIKGTNIEVPLDLDSTEQQLIEDKGVSVGGGHNNSNLTFPLFDKPNDVDLDENYRGSLNWNNHYIIIGLSKLVSDPNIDAYFDTIREDRFAGIQRFQELQERYVTRLLMKGVF
jgi:hypothetical protein|tara:strand:+ start:50 stop:991 length:942 start_codon:yes stop_codon:yes gene_type:complete